MRKPSVSYLTRCKGFIVISCLKCGYGPPEACRCVEMELDDPNAPWNLPPWKIPKN